MLKEASKEREHLKVSRFLILTLSCVRHNSETIIGSFVSLSAAGEAGHFILFSTYSLVDLFFYLQWSMVYVGTLNLDLHPLVQSWFCLILSKKLSLLHFTFMHLAYTLIQSTKEVANNIQFQGLLEN